MATIDTGVPPSQLIPLFWATVDGSQAGNLTETEPALLIGQAFLSGAATGAAHAGITGNGTIAMDSATPVLPGAQLGTYTAKFTDATHFTVKDPSNVTVGTGVTGTAFALQVKFTITAGVTAFVNDDQFDITVSELPAGTAQYGEAYPIGSEAEGRALFGEGSMLSRMILTFLKGNTTQVLYAIAVPKPRAGHKATGSIKVATAPASSGTLFVYIAGQLVQVAVFSTDTAAIVATYLAFAINALKSLPVKAAVDGSDKTKVNLTSKHHGLIGNDITIVPNYRGQAGGEAYPAGLTLTIRAMSGGTGNPDFTAAISAIQALGIYNFAMPYGDTGSLQAWDAEVGFGPTGRWSYIRQQYGWIYHAIRGDYATLLAWGQKRNSAVISSMAVEPDSPSPVWEWAAAYCAQGAASILNDAALPLHTLELPGILPAPVKKRFSPQQLNNLIASGLAVQQTAPSGQPQIMSERLQYKFNNFGQSDTAFMYITTLSNLAELLTRMKSAITSKYRRVKLAPDGTNFGIGQRVITPKIVKAELVAEMRTAEQDGLVAQVDQFIKALAIAINDQNPDRIDVLYPPRLIGKLRIFAVLTQFRLQYPQTN